MKKKIIIFGILLLFSFKAFSQTDNSTIDVVKQQTVTQTAIKGGKLVLPKLPATLTLVITADDLTNYSIAFLDKTGKAALTLATSVSKDDAQHVQLKYSDLDGSNLVLLFAGGKLAGICPRTLKTPPTIPITGTKATTP